jgi:hypothetical protein
MHSHHLYRLESISKIKKQKGMALLIMVSMIVIAMTAMAITHLSLNAQSIKRQQVTIASMAKARDTVIAFAITQNIPGSVPCPDTNNDGLQNISAGVCTSRIGLLPYRTLNIAPLYDGANQLLWYAVDTSYTGTLVTPHNSSRVANLQIDAGSSQIFIVIAPNISLGGQSPTTPTPANVAQYLEGDNADATLNSYSTLKDDTHNDQLLGATAFDFWIQVERRVLEDVRVLLNNYKNACAGVWPWAANFGTAASVMNTYEGSLPVGTTLPTNWNTGCAVGITPGYLATHWSGNLYYAICKEASPNNPPAASCLSFAGKTAKVIALSPGVTLATQNRSVSAINQFYEGNDASINDNQFDSLTPGATDNDLLISIEN